MHQRYTTNLMKMRAHLADGIPPFLELRDSLGGRTQVEPKSRRGFGQDILPSVPSTRQARDSRLNWQKAIFKVGGRDILEAGHCHGRLERSLY